MLRRLLLAIPPLAATVIAGSMVAMAALPAIPVITVTPVTGSPSQTFDVTYTAEQSSGVCGSKVLFYWDTPDNSLGPPQPMTATSGAGQPGCTSVLHQATAPAGAAAGPHLVCGTAGNAQGQPAAGCATYTLTAATVASPSPPPSTTAAPAASGASTGAQQAPSGDASGAPVAAWVALLLVAAIAGSGAGYMMWRRTGGR